MDFSVIAKAGLNNGEAAKVLGVSTVMMWKYVSGKAEPRPVLFKGVDLRERAEVMLKVLAALVAKGSLPKPELTWSPKMDPELRVRRANVIAKLTKLIDERVAKTTTNE